MTAKIISMELENVKRVALVRLAPAENGLTVIGGDNCQGKTSVLDGIMFALGGEKYRPDRLQREGGLAPARIRIVLSNGLVVERRGKNASLKVTDPSGKNGGQRLLDAFVEELALNLPRFVAMRDDEKAEVLLRILGIEEKLQALDLREKAAYDRRHDFGVIAARKKSYAAELPFHPGLPETPVKGTEVLEEIRAIHQRNARREEARREVLSAGAELGENRSQCDMLTTEIRRLQEKRHVLLDRNAVLEDILRKAEAHPVEEDESCEDLQGRLDAIEETNDKIRENLEKARAMDDAEECERQLRVLTEELDGIREERRALLEGADMPLPELSIGKNGKGRPALLYHGQTWDGMSGMERIRVATAIVRKLKPGCGFILLDGMEAFDRAQLESFDQWLQNEGLQAICTRVGKEACSIVIEDGVAVDENAEPAPEIPDPMAPIPMDIQEPTETPSDMEMDF